MPRSNNNSCIGLLIDAVEMRAVEISGTPANYRIGTFGRVALPQGIISDGLIIDVPGAAQILSGLLRDGGFSQSAPLLPGAKNQNVLLRMASFPKVPENRVYNAVMYQAQQFIPVPVQELMLDYIPCGEIKNDERVDMHVLLVGAKRSFLDNMIDIARHAGRILHDIDSAVLASLRAVMTSPEAAGGSFMMADINHETMSIIICRNSLISMTRTVVLPQQFAQAVRNAGDHPLFPPETARALASMISSDIQASLQFYTAQDSDAPGVILLTGSSGVAGQLAPFTSEILNTQTRVPTMYPGLRGVDTAGYATCISLALRGLEG